MQELDAAQRVRLRIQDWVKKQGHGSKKLLAEVVNGMYGAERGAPWVTGILKGGRVKGGQDLRLKDLDAIAKLMDVPPGQLVRKFDRNYLELTMAETRVLQCYRVLPNELREAWLKILEFFFSGRTPNLLTPAGESGVKPVRPVQGGGRAHDSGSANTGIETVSVEVLAAERAELLQRISVYTLAVNDLTTRIDALSTSTPERAGNGGTRSAAGDHPGAGKLARHRARKK